MNFDHKTILVTGASGFIGSHIVATFARRPDGIQCARTHALSRSLGRLGKLPSSAEFEFHACSLLDRSEMNALIERINPHIVFHLASHHDAQESFEQASNTISTNVNGTLNLLDAFNRCSNAEVFVYGDSTKVFGNADAPYQTSTPINPNSSYAISKAAGWHLSKLYGEHSQFNSISIRPTLIYGPHQPMNLFRFITDSLLNGETSISLFGGDQTRAPLYISDAVRAYLCAAEVCADKNGLALNIGGSVELTVEEIAVQIIDAMGIDASVHCSPAQRRATEIIRSVADLSEAARVLDWQPQIDLTQGLQSLIKDMNIPSPRAVQRQALT